MLPPTIVSGLYLLAIFWLLDRYMWTNTSPLASYTPPAGMSLDQSLRAFGMANERLETSLTLDNVQRTFHEVGVEMDQHTLVVPGHEGH